MPVLGMHCWHRLCKRLHKSNSMGIRFDLLCWIDLPTKSFPALSLRRYMMLDKLCRKRWFSSNSSNRSQTVSGSEFHKVGPEMAKLRWPYLIVLEWGPARSLCGRVAACACEVLCAATTWHSISARRWLAFIAVWSDVLKSLFKCQRTDR